MYKHHPRLTNDLSDLFSLGHVTIMSETRKMYEMATRRSNVIEATSAAVEELVKTEQRLLRHGVDSLAPGVTRLEDVEDPGSIDDIAGNFCGSLTHMDGQLRKLGRSTIYKICRYLDDIKLPLEKSYEAIHEWEEKEQERYNAWRTINLESLESKDKLHQLGEAHIGLYNLVRGQLELLMSLKNEFTSVTDAKEGHRQLMSLLARRDDAQNAIQQVMAQKQLDKDEAKVEAGEIALMEAIHPRVNFHRSTIIPLVEKYESIAGLEACELLIDFKLKIQREKEKIENAIGVEKRLSEF